MEQLQRADRAIFKKISEPNQGSVAPRPGGRTTVDDAMDAAINDHTVRVLLLPLPNGAVSSSDDDPETPGKRQRNELGDDEEEKKPPKGGCKGKGKGKGKGRDGKGRERDQRMPEVLKGLNPRDKSGKPICFDYNISECKRLNCSMKHVCAKRLKDHAFVGSACQKGGA